MTSLERGPEIRAEVQCQVALFLKQLHLALWAKVNQDIMHLWTEKIALQRKVKDLEAEIQALKSR